MFHISGTRARIQTGWMAYYRTDEVVRLSRIRLRIDLLEAKPACIGNMNKTIVSSNSPLPSIQGISCPTASTIRRPSGSFGLSLGKWNCFRPNSDRPSRSTFERFK